MSSERIVLTSINQENKKILNHILEGVFDYTILSASLDNFLNSGTHHLIVALNESKVVVGFISYVDIFHPDKHTQVFINELSVHPSYQRLGIGTKLMRHAFRYAEKHAYYVWVATEMENHEADQFYQRLKPNSKQASWFYDWKVNQEVEND